MDGDDELRRELAEARRERARLLDLLRHVPAAITFLRGRDLVIEFAHPIAMAALGNRPLEGRPLLEAVPEFAHQPHVARMMRVFETGQTSEETVVVHADPTGTGVIEESHWHSTYQAIRGEGGAVERILTFDIEVTKEVQQRRRLEHLQEMTAALSSALTIEDVARVVVEEGGAKLGAARGGLWRLSADGAFLELLHDKDYSPELREAVRRVPVDSDMPLARVLAAGAPCFVSSREEYEQRFGASSRRTYAVRTSDETAFFCAPLIVEGKVVGCMSLNHGRRHEYREDERRFIEALVDQCAIALHRAELVSSEQTARKAAEREQTRFRAIFEQSQDGILLTDASTIVVDVNPAACAILHRSREEMIGKPGRDLLPPDDRATLDARLDELQKAGRVALEERRLLLPDGTTRLFELSASANVVPGLNLTTFRDIEDRKRAEQNIRFLEEASRMFASSLDPERTLAALARLAVPRLSDWAAVDMLDDDGSERRVAVEHVDPAKVALAHAMRQRRPEGSESGVLRVIRTGEPMLVERITDEMLVQSLSHDPEYLEMVRSAGLFSLMIIPLPVRGKGRGAITFAFGESRRQFGQQDVRFAEELARRAGAAFENALAYRELARAYEAEATALRKKDEFLAMLGHELRNPLAPILTATSLIRLRGKASERELGILERQSKHLVRLVDDLLDISRIQSGKLALRREPLEIADVVAQAMESVSKALEDKRLRVHVVAPATGLVVEGDRERLVQVVTNVLVNAAKFTPAGRALHVTATRQDGGARIEIRDEGEGIAPEVLPGIFAPFTQGPQASDRRDGGLGLGLSIARSLVEAHGGTIEASSPGRDRGTTITIHLPLSAAVPQAAEGHTPQRGASPSTARRRILIVDDNTDAAEMIATLLGDLGYETQTASDGPQALTAALRTPPDAAILDIGLPGMDGYELAAELRSRLGDRVPRLIALTGYAQATDRDRALGGGFYAHFAKPVDMDKLVAAVEAIAPMTTGPTTTGPMTRG